MEKEAVVKMPYQKLSPDGERRKKRRFWDFLNPSTLLLVALVFNSVNQVYQLRLMKTKYEVLVMAFANQKQMNELMFQYLQKFKPSNVSLNAALKGLAQTESKEEDDYTDQGDDDDSPDGDEDDEETYSFDGSKSSYEDQGESDGDDNFDYEEEEEDEYVRFFAENEDNEKKRGSRKTKREIWERESSEQKDGEDKTTNADKKSMERTSSEVPSTEVSWSSPTNSSEYVSRELFIPETYRVSRKSHVHRKHRKTGNGSAERFFTETHSTTSTPIQVRRSRTKATNQGHETRNRRTWLRNQMQHTSPIKDTTKRDEAAQKSFGRYLQNVNQNLASEDHEPDAPSYNIIIIHFSADTSHYSRERDPHYFGNGRMQIKSDVYKDWKAAHWTQGVGMSKYFQLNQGRVTLSTTGIYLIYAQIQYSNVQEVNGFSVFRNNEVVVQCITTSTHPDKHEIKSNTCGISTTILLQSNDTVYIKDLHHGRYVVLTPEKSYFGLVLLSPIKN